MLTSVHIVQWHSYIKISQMKSSTRNLKVSPSTGPIWPTPRAPKLDRSCHLLVRYIHRISLVLNHLIWNRLSVAERQTKWWIIPRLAPRRLCKQQLVQVWYQTSKTGKTGKTVMVRKLPIHTQMLRSPALAHLTSGQHNISRSFSQSDSHRFCHCINAELLSSIQNAMLGYNVCTVQD